MLFKEFEGMTTQSQRLKEARLKAGLSQKQVAEAVGMKQPSYNYLEKNDKGGSTHLPEIARVLGVDVFWLRTGESATKVDASVQKMLDSSRNIPLNDLYNNEGVWIDLVNVRFSCGDGESVEFHFDDVKRRVRFDSEFFAHHNVKPENVRLVEALGDSQEPFVCSGDLFAIDISDVEIRDGKYYAVYFEGEAMLKRISKEAGGVLRLQSLNPKYIDKVVSKENGAEFRVIGRQFWRAG